MLALIPRHVVRLQASFGSDTYRDACLPTEVLTLFAELWNLRDTAFPDRWYGLTITVYPNGKSESAFSYDPDCALDEAFFES